MNIEELMNPVNELIGPVTSKRLFAGYGIFKGDIIFIVCEGEKTYLHAEGDLVNVLKKLGAAPYPCIDPLVAPHQVLYHYYEISDEIINNKELFKKLMKVSIGQIKEARLKEELLKKNRIKEMINLSIKHERLLAKIGVYTVTEFRDLGAYNAFVRLRKLGLDTSLQLFFMFYAALRNRNVYTLSDKEKERELIKLNDILVANGLKKLKSKL